MALNSQQLTRNTRLKNPRVATAFLLIRHELLGDIGFSVIGVPPLSPFQMSVMYLSWTGSSSLALVWAIP
jgi:hypothetical protein